MSNVADSDSHTSHANQINHGWKATPEAQFPYFYGDPESRCEGRTLFFFLSRFFFNFYFYFILLYNTVLVLPYIDMNPPQVYMRSQT